MWNVTLNRDFQFPFGADQSIHVLQKKVIIKIVTT